LEFAERLGSILAQLTPTRCQSLRVCYSGRITEQDTTAVTRAALKGFLKETGSQVNEVNAPKFAERLGLEVSEQKQTIVESEYHELVTVRAVDGEGKPFEVSGTFFGNIPHIVRINGYNVEARPEGVLMIFMNKDRPGIVGQIGTILGKYDVNIASMSLSRGEAGSQALSVLNLDSVPSEECLAALREDRDITDLRFAKV
jgi:D-3-phosphoglycerate dehydrogenase